MIYETSPVRVYECAVGVHIYGFVGSMYVVLGFASFNLPYPKHRNAFSISLCLRLEMGNQPNENAENMSGRQHDTGAPEKKFENSVCQRQDIENKQKGTKPS